MNFQNVNDVDEALKHAELTVRDLYAMYEQRQPVRDAAAQKYARGSPDRSRQVAWLQDSLSMVLQFSKRALEKEEFLLVCDVATEALDYWKGDNDEDRTNLVRLRMNYATALSRLGYTRDARKQLEPCAADAFRPQLGRTLKAEILLQLGNILRDESLYATARTAQLLTANEALEFYRRSLSLDPQRLETLGLAAAAALVLGEPGSALRLEARQRADLILDLTAKLEDSEGPRVQSTRARATAYAVLEDIENAAKCYGRLQSMDGVTTTDLADARYYAQFLAEAIGKPRDLFKKAFPLLQLVVFVGHLPDLPGGPVRFPQQAVESVRQAIRAKLTELDVRVGLVSAAAGADLLFVEAMRERNGVIHLLLPWSREEFRQTSVLRYEAPGSAPIWEPLFDRALNNAATIREIGQAYEPGSDVGWQYMLEVTAGLAIQTARVSRLDVQPMALWDGRPGWGVGGTSSFVRFWQQEFKQEVIRIGLPEVPIEEDPGPRRGVSRRCETPTLHQEVKSMLFADIVGYSRLTERVIPEFVAVFMARVSQLAATSKHAPRSVNTWGDAIYGVFDFAFDAGCFALELTQMIQEGRNDWLQRGLYWEEHDGDGKEPIKNPLNIRIGLHTGPVFMHYDPVVRRLGFTGAHVNRAARIEPVTRPGEVYASEEFAALAELAAEIRRHSDSGEPDEQFAGFVSQYAGSMELAKGYPGRFRIYRVLPKRTFAVEELAKAAHEAFCAEALARGETPLTNSSMRPWEELTEDLRDSNRAQVADIPNKLRYLGYELAPSYGIAPSDILITDIKVEEMAVAEHERWRRDRERHGWSYGPKRDNRRKLHPLMVDWAKLMEQEKEKDRDTVRNLPRLIERAGFRVRLIDPKPTP